MVEAKIRQLIGVIIAVAVGVILTEVIQSTLASSNITGTPATLLNLTPLFVAIGILLFVIKSTM